MKKWLGLLIIFLLISYVWSLGQVIPSNTEPIPECPFVRLPVGLDSTDVQTGMDSISKLISGKWNLIKVVSGWNKARKQTKTVTMSLDSQGQGTIYENGRLVSTYQLTLNAFYSYIRFSVNEKGGIFFGFSAKSRGYLRLCERILILRVNAAEGEAYVFERIAPKQASYR